MRYLIIGSNRINRDEQDEVFQEAIARNNQESIRGDFDVNPEEQFKVILSLGDAMVTEQFIL